jgi:hypothetical protein
MPSWTIESFNHSRGFVKDQSKYGIHFIFVLNIHLTLLRRGKIAFTDYYAN